MLTPEQLTEIEARANAATPGTWHEGDVWVYTDPIYENDNRLSNVLGMTYSDPERAGAEHQRALRNVRFIAHAREDIPDLLADVRQLTEDRDQARAEAKQWHDTYQQHAGAVDEFFGDLLELLPGAEDTGMDAYDQIPRAIKALRTERDRRDKAIKILGAHLQGGAQDVKDVLAAMVDLEAQRDMARDAAVALEQENARLRERIDEAVDTLGRFDPISGYQRTLVLVEDLRRLLRGGRS